MLANPNGTMSVANVTFEPGCRNHWHIHHAAKGGGQLLLCVDGEGWYQAEGEAPRRLKEGDVVFIPAGVKHWHGAAPGSAMTHISICEETEPGKVVEWLEPVTDSQYAGR